MKGNTLVIIDPQYDFCDVPEDKRIDGIAPALPVTGAWDDCLRLRDYIMENKDQIDNLVVFLDSHAIYDIAHPLFWVDADGEYVKPHTPITNKQIRDGVYRPDDKTQLQYVLDYTADIEASGLQSHYVWPEHCIEKTVGHSVAEPVMQALIEYGMEKVRFVKKGQNQYTEFYGGFAAQRPYNGDDKTEINQDLINEIAESDEIYFSGQALSHCVAATVRQYLANEPEGNATKILLTNTTSAVPGFEADAENFLSEVKGKVEFMEVGKKPKNEPRQKMRV